MTLPEVDELLRLNGWTKTELAGRLRLSEAAVMKWYRLGRVPDGPGAILLRLWLEEARRQHNGHPVNGKAKSGKPNGKAKATV